MQVIWNIRTPNGVNLISLLIGVLYVHATDVITQINAARHGYKGNGWIHREAECWVGCLSKQVPIWNNQNGNRSSFFGTIRTFVLVVSLLHWNIDFLCFDWTETNRKPTETVWYAANFGIFSGNLGFFQSFSVYFGLFQNRWFRLFRFYTETESFDILIEPKQTEDQPKQFDREHILVFLRKYGVVSVCFGLLQNSSVCFYIGSKHRNKMNKPKFVVFCFMK